MYYEIINPSDKCGFYADTHLVAVLVTLLLGNGQYSAQPSEDGAEEVPFFMFGGFDEYWAERFPDEPVDGVMDRHEAEIITALRSTCYGSSEDRKIYDAALEAITDDAKRAEFVEKWNDENRSSMNNIMGRAHELADRLSAKAAA